MFNVRADQMISMIVESNLNKFDYQVVCGNRNIIKRGGIVIPFLLRVDDFSVANKSGGDKATMRLFMALFTGNVQVFYTDISEQHHYYPDKVRVDHWINTCNHDSCWRSDGLSFITQAYFDMCKQVNADVAPKDLSSHFSFTHHEFFHRVSVITQNKKDENYVREVVSLEMCKTK